MSARDLWCEVLRFALTDAINGMPAASYLTGAERRVDARAYVLQPNADFALVCDLAGVDPEAVRGALKRQLVKGLRATLPRSGESWSGRTWP